jgi:fructose-1,6-bisphosphatase/inositol monophosphatase family enzyme
MATYREETDLALMMAREAAKVILPHFRTDIRVDTKADNSPVTIADRNSEEAIRKLMEKHTPGYGIIGEEFANG